MQPLPPQNVEEPFGFKKLRIFGIIFWVLFSLGLAFFLTYFEIYPVDVLIEWQIKIRVIYDIFPVTMAVVWGVINILVVLLRRIIQYLKRMLFFQ